MRIIAIAVTAVLCLLFACSLCLASVPPMINYQGKLMQPSGVPVPDGTFSMTFAIYSVPTGGTALWSETNPSVQVKGGLFSVLLGSVNNLPANIFDGPDRWFGVTVGADPEMTPRQKIASVAFAEKAALADLATTVPDGAITAVKLAPDAVTVGSVADGTLTAAKFAAGVATPVGTMSMFGGSSAPTGWLMCDGSAVSRTTYAALFAAIGTAFGAGDGSTTFNLPNLQDAFPIGISSTKALGATGGEATHVLTIDEMPPHIHNFPYGMVSWPIDVAGWGWGGGWSNTAHPYVKNITVSGSSGSGAAHNNMPPYVAVDYMIKY